MSKPIVKISKGLFDLDGNGIEITVEYDKEYNTVERIVSAKAVKFRQKGSIDITDVLTQYLGLDKIVEGIDWQEAEREQQSSTEVIPSSYHFDVARRAMQSSANHE